MVITPYIIQLNENLIDERRKWRTNEKVCDYG
ncbi:hypothetical protein LINPERHAP2_LOCUS38875, partial [Linum perenne]